jgi:outer membrane protein OmpA-like peptidoglycan-associated protein
MARRGILISAVLHVSAVAAAAGVQMLPDVIILHEGSPLASIPVPIPVEIATASEIDQQMRVAPSVQNHVMALVLPVAFVEAAHVAIDGAAVPDAVDVDPPPQSEDSPTPPAAPSDPVVIARPQVTDAPIAAISDPLASIFNSQFTEDKARELREHLPDRIEVQREGKKLRLNMLGDVLFELDSADLQPEARALIATLAGELAHYGFTLIAVNGYTDTSGTEEHNLRLSQDRADAVAGELIRDGVEPPLIRAQGYGGTELAVLTPQGVREPRNRRVEIVLSMAD